VLACGGSGRSSVAARVPSPSGCCEASIVEYEGTRTVVEVSFDGGRCVQASVHSPGVRLGLRIRWVDGGTLEVRYPPGVLLDLPAGPVLHCQEREVRLVLSKK
jgi:hypothetical protein